MYSEVYRVRRIPFIIGIIMIIAGIFFFWWYFQILWYGDFIENLWLWIISLIIGTLLISLGPGVIAWSYASSYRSSYKTIAKQKEWQVIQVPMKCPECQKEISIRSLEWIGDDEARCPFCSNDLEIRSSRSFSYS